MLALLICANALSGYDFRSPGSMISSRPWLPLSDGMPLAINEPYIGSDSVFDPIFTRPKLEGDHLMQLHVMGHHLQGSAQLQMAIPNAAAATCPNSLAPRPASTSSPSAVPLRPHNPPFQHHSGDGEAVRPPWHLPWRDLVPNMAPHPKCSLFWHSMDMHN